MKERKETKKLLINAMLLFFLVHIFFLNIAYGEGEVDLSEFPERLSSALGIPEFAGELLASVLLMALFLFPAMLLTKGKKSQEYVILFVGFSVIGVCIALGWFPYFMLLIIAMLVALMYAGKMRSVIGGN